MWGSETKKAYEKCTYLKMYWDFYCSEWFRHSAAGSEKALFPYWKGTICIFMKVFSLWVGKWCNPLWFVKIRSWQFARVLYFGKWDN